MDKKEVINAVLIRGSCIQDGKLRIYNYFKEDHTVKQYSQFLKNEYGEGGFATGLGFFSKFKTFLSTHGAKGIRIYYVALEDDQQVEINVSWVAAVNYITELINSDEYMTYDERLKYSIPIKAVQLSFF